MAALLAQAGIGVALLFTTVAQGSSSQILEPRTVVVRSQAEWQTLWQAHSARPIPEVDFSESLVAGVFLGTRPTAGYEVEILSATLSEGRVRVEYEERQPPSTAIVAQVLTSPYHLILLPGDVEAVEFQPVASSQAESPPSGP